MASGLTTLDTLVLAAYLGGILGVSWAVARRQRTGEDYFLAGRRMAGGTLSLSILANQTSAVSLVGAPAFVALREGGGLRWLQYELALPLAMLVLIAAFLPALRSVAGSSIYAYADGRFGPGARRTLAAAFLLSRGLALGVILYASALVVAEGLGWPVDAAILAVGLFSVAYTSLGGIVADIWSDVIQLALLWAGTIVSAAYLLAHGGFAVVDAIPLDRARALVFDGTGLGDGATFSFWPMLIGGFFLYLSYYGCDQSQAQRLLTARNEAAARRALVLNGLLRFPLVLTYCGFGLLLAGLLRVDAAFAAAMQGRPADSLVPAFMMTYLPAGLRGLLFAGILAAAMSSIDSAMNSLAAITLEDLLDRPPASQGVWLARGVSLAWGVWAVGAALVFARSGRSVLELINQVGSIFYGPVLAVFAAGVFTRGVTSRAVVAGLAGGLLVNLALARLAPGVSWLWWNPTGFVTTFVLASAVGRGRLIMPAMAITGREALLLGSAFVLMLGVLAAL